MAIREGSGFGGEGSTFDLVGRGAPLALAIAERGEDLTELEQRGTGEK
jgi:hypothetical protein